MIKTIHIVEHSYRLICDHAGCEKHVTQSPRDVDQTAADNQADRYALRRDAESYGWTRRSGKDYCPDHSERLRKGSDHA